LRPADLIRMGIATAEQFDGVQFKASEDLDSLPQIVNAKKDINVTSFWGDGSQCSIGIKRPPKKIGYGLEIYRRSSE
jgi:hypothetical protein